MAENYNFKKECLYKYDLEVFNMFLDLFNYLPLASIINNKFFAVHSGISPNLKKIENINKINRFQEIPHTGLFTDLVWSDPVDNDEGLCDDDYRFNENRKCSFFYGKDACNNFLSKNNLWSIIRSNEIQLDGYKMHKWNGNEFPMVITIFSSPNFDKNFNNKGSVILIENNTYNIIQFIKQEEPYILNNHMNTFEWSIPFISLSTNKIFLELLLKLNIDNENNDESKALNKELNNKIIILKKNIRILKESKDHNESKIILKETIDEDLPEGYIMSGNQAIEKFKKSKKFELKNYARPGY